MTASDNTKFRFDTDGEGNYGYLKGDGTFIPFSGNTYNVVFNKKSGCNQSLLNTVYRFDKQYTKVLLAISAAIEQSPTINIDYNLSNGTVNELYDDTIVHVENKYSVRTKIIQLNNINIGDVLNIYCSWIYTIVIIE